MVLTFTIASKDVEDFVLNVKIDADATFADLQYEIRQACGWADDVPASFFVCDDRWHPHTHIPEVADFEHDSMAEVALGDHLEDEGQRMLYVFDPDGQRHLLMEVSRIAYGDTLDAPRHRLHGTAPEQVLLPEPEPTSSAADLLAQLNAAALGDLDEDDEEERDDFEGFDPEEFDPEGFEISEGE